MLDKLFSIYVKISVVWALNARILNPLYWIIVGILLYLLDWRVMFCGWVVYSLIGYVLMLRRYDRLDSNLDRYFDNDEDDVE